MGMQQRIIQKFLDEYAPSKLVEGRPADADDAAGDCLLIVSSTSGFGNASRLAPIVVEYLRPHFRSIKIIPTTHAGHVYEIMQNEEPDDLCQSYQVAVILGGDGAFSEAVNGMLNRPGIDQEKKKKMVTLAHCPGGSGCSTSGNTMGVWKGSDVEKACQIIAKGKVGKLDVLEVTNERRSEKRSYSISTVAGGLFTDIVELADTHYKWTYSIFGPTARYAFGMIHALLKFGTRDNHRMIRYTITTSDNQSERVEVLPTNGFSLYNDGRPMEHAHYSKAKFNDGTMSLVLEKHYLGLMKHLKYVGDLAKGKTLNDDVKDNHFVCDNIISIKVEQIQKNNNNAKGLPPRLLKTMLDGEKGQGNADYMIPTFSAEVLPGKIDVIVA